MFKFDDKWDVDTTAESLNVSLFGQSKKHKAIVPASANSDSKFSSRGVPDSDDELYSKNDKKRLKKWRKKNRVNENTSENSPIKLPQNHHALSPKKNMKKGNKSVETTDQKLKTNTSLVKSNSTIVNLNNNKLKYKEHEDNTFNSLSENQTNKNSRKRKLSQSDITDNNIVKNKKFKVKEDISNEISTKDDTASDGKKKRKRNRKKKNNSKKNKYKHLALNSKNKTGDLDISEVSESIDGSTEKESVNKKNDNKTVDIIPNKLFIKSNKSPMKTVTHIPGALQQDTTNEHNSSINVGVNSLNDKRSKKRKKNKQSNDDNSEKDQLAIKKIKKFKDHSKDEALGKVSQPQPVREVSEFVYQNSALSKVTSKNKLKQQVLIKVNGEQKNQPAGTIESRKLNLTLNKKKKNKQAVTSVPSDGDINSCVLTKHSIIKNTIKNNEEKGVQQGNTNKNPPVNTVIPASQSIWGKAAELGQQAKEKLNSARFRFINEQLYSCSGNDALKLFREDQDAFSVYHDGFQNQASKWPVNPLDIFIKHLKDKPKNLIIADFGCGDAKLAQNVPQKVHSFDLVALNDAVTVCDMSKTPLPSEQVDIAVFCLSLMGTNISDYIHEANRVLKIGGLLKVAEVVSRFSGLSRFTDGVCSYGFQLLNKRDVNQMFYLMDFKKTKFVKKSSTLPEIKLKPCIYKRR